METHKEFNPEQTAFEFFAAAHPHEAFIYSPERFIAFVQKQNPDLTRQQIVAALRASNIEVNNQTTTK